MMPSILSGLAGSLAFPLTIQKNICVSPKKKHFIPATIIAIMINADQILLNAIEIKFQATNYKKSRLK
jgi:hypothetical protein